MAKGNKLIYTLTKQEILHEAEAKGLITIKEGRISYHALGKERSFNDTTPEEKVRAELYVDLIEKYGYKADPNVIEIEKSHTIGRPKSSGAEIDILIKKENNPFMMFELKSPEEYEKEMEQAIKKQLFGVAPVEDPKGKNLKYLIYYTKYYSADGEVVEKIITIDYTKYKTYDDWVDGERPNLMMIPKNYGVVRKPVFTKKGPRDLRTDVTKDELERIRWNLHNILWGGGKYQTELFFNLMGLFLVKIYDEKETEDYKPYNFQIFYENGEPEEPKKVYHRINELYKVALKEYLGYSDEELRKVKDIVFDAPKVKYVVEVLQEISLTVNKYDIIGDFFEKIVRSEFKQTKGQYLTHPNIVNFIIRALFIEKLAFDLVNEEKRFPYIIDPACGSGTFLIESMKLVTSYLSATKENLRKSASVSEFIASMLPKNRENAWANWYIYGIEINGDLATATKVNMVGHGDGHANIEAKDAFFDFEEFTKDLLQIKKNSTIYSKPINEQFDVVISNPPFSITVDRDTAKNFPKIFMWGEKIAANLQKQKKEMEVSTENLFIERWYQLLRPKGRLGVVLPESVFDTTENRYIRLFLYKYFWIKAVVSLPYLSFQPYTATKTSLLFAQKKTPQEIKEWNELWQKYEKQYDEIKNNMKNLLKKQSSESKENKNLTKNKLASIIKKLLKDDFNDKDLSLDSEILKDKYSDEIKQADKEWWVFGEVAKEINYPIFMAHTEEIGYKRGVRGEEKRPNQLFQQDEEGNIIIDITNPKTILDYLRKQVKWS